MPLSVMTDLRCARNSAICCFRSSFTHVWLEEEESFDFEDVAGAIADKLVRRHPHVFDKENHSSEESLRDAWETLKAEERAEKASSRGENASVLDDVPVGFPALTRAEKLQKRAARVGFDWDTIAPVLAKLEEEIAELKEEMQQGGSPERLSDEMGDVLFLFCQSRTTPEDRPRIRVARNQYQV